MREASDASAPGSPPSPSTIHSATLSQRVPALGVRPVARASRRTWPACTSRSAAGRCARRSPAARPRSARASSLAARVVPGDRRDDGPQRVVGQHAGLGHARHADADHRAGRCSAARAASSAAASSASGSSSAPVGTGRQGVGARPWESSRPASSTTAALTAVVPTSNPRSNLSISPPPVCRRCIKTLRSEANRCTRRWRRAGSSSCPAMPQQVWDGFTKHAAAYLWPITYEPRVGGAERGLTSDGGTVTVWDPPRHFRTEASRPDGWFNTLDYILDGNHLRYVHTCAMEAVRVRRPVRRVHPAHEPLQPLARRVPAPLRRPRAALPRARRRPRLDRRRLRAARRPRRRRGR